MTKAEWLLLGATLFLIVAFLFIVGTVLAPAAARIEKVGLKSVFSEIWNGKEGAGTHT